MINWLNEISTEALEEARVVGDRPSPYYSKKVGNRFLDLSGDFLLWSSVMVPKFKSPYIRASSAPVESDFGNLKRRILKNEAGPLALHRFVTLHLKSISGQTKISLAEKQGLKLIICFY